MNKPQTINGLMRHLRNDCNIQIKGGKQKQQLISYGYYHGYKGYRFFQKSQNKIPYTDFSEVVAVIEYDNNIKSALYPHLMFIETAIKNIVCNSSVMGLSSGTFDYVYKQRMNDSTVNTSLQSSRLKLRNSVYSRLSLQYSSEDRSDNQMVRHFYNRGEDVPLWVVFEILYLSDLATFFKCSRSKFLTKLLKTFDKTFREIFPVFISTKRREKPSAFFDNNFVNNAYFSEAASSSSSHLASSSSKAPISSRMTCLCLWSS